MSKRIPVCRENKTIYEIVIESAFDGLDGEMDALGAAAKKLCIVTDSGAGALYAGKVQGKLEGHAREIHVFSFEAGEASKTLRTVERLYTFLIERHFERKDMLIALGGGVTGDLTGFAAATYLRGIEFIQIPTTLLAQVDSSIGGKTGVDFDQYKNMVGAFHMPKLVFINLSVLKTLDDRQFASGMAEILKHGLIKDAGYYEWILSNMDEIRDKQADIMEELIYKSCLIKKTVVEKDPTEQGERALLNFGHTIGHAVEKYMDFKLLHGECVALGCVAASYISWQRGLLSEEEYYEIRDMFVPFGLPISMSHVDDNKIVELTKADKKMEKGMMKFVLLKKVGRAFIDMTVTEEEMLAAVKEIHFYDEAADGGEAYE